MSERTRQGRSLSVVVPVFNEQECLPVLAAELETHLDLLGLAYEVIFVDDCSKDRTPDIIDELSQKRPKFKGVRLSRNSGHQAALSCGLALAQGDIVISMDGDLQHPPAMITTLLEYWEQGYDIVNTARKQTEASGFVDRQMSVWFYRLFNRIADVRLVPGSADFRLLDRRCVDALNSMREFFKFFRGQVPYIGFRQITVPFDCPPRFAGRRSYTLRQSLRLASNGLLSFSTFGLKVPFVLGLIVLGIVAAYVVVSFGLVLTGRAHLAEGWLSLFTLLFLSIGLQLTFLGMIGLYVGKIFIEVKGRPLYFVDRTYGRVGGAQNSVTGVSRQV